MGSRGKTAALFGGILLAALVVSPAIGGPSLRSLVKKEVSKQIGKATGPQGPQGPAGTSAPQPGGTLPAGATLKGVFGPSASSPAATGQHGAGQGVSFGGGAYSLPARPNANVIGVGGNSTANCPGTLTAPSATSGNLCVYLRQVFGDTIIVSDPTQFAGINFAIATGVITPFGDAKVSTMGFRVVVGEDTAGGIASADGTWAVTP